MKSIIEWKQDHAEKIKIVRECKSVIKEIVPDCRVILYGSVILRIIFPPKTTINRPENRARI